MLDLIAGVSVSRQTGRFTVRSWTELTATGEQPMGVDQTNESVIVGGAAVVKWATHLQEGPHPGASADQHTARRRVHRDAAPWGLVTWQPPDGAETLVAYVDEYLPGAVDGWTWAVELVTSAAVGRDAAEAVAAAAEVGSLVAELHAALSPTVSLASDQDAARWHADALQVLETACALSDSVSTAILRDHRDRLSSELEILGSAGRHRGDRRPRRPSRRSGAALRRPLRGD